MACEIAVQRAFSAAFRERDIVDLQEPVIDFLNGYNLGNPRIRRLYEALSGNAIPGPLVRQIEQSARRRNDIVHEGRAATDQEARESLLAATTLVHLVMRGGG